MSNFEFVIDLITGVLDEWEAVKVDYDLDDDLISQGFEILKEHAIARDAR